MKTTNILGHSIKIIENEWFVCNWRHYHLLYSKCIDTGTITKAAKTTWRISLVWSRQKNGSVVHHLHRRHWNCWMHISSETPIHQVCVFVSSRRYTIPKCLEWSQYPRIISKKKKTKKIAMCISLPSWEIDVQFSHQNHTGHRVSQMHQFKFFSGVFFGSLQLKNVHLWCAKDSVVDFNYLIVHRVCVLVAFQL